MLCKLCCVLYVLCSVLLCVVLLCVPYYCVYFVLCGLYVCVLCVLHMLKILCVLCVLYMCSMCGCCLSCYVVCEGVASRLPDCLCPFRDISAPASCRHCDPFPLTQVLAITFLAAANWAFWCSRPSVPHTHKHTYPTLRNHWSWGRRVLKEPAGLPEKGPSAPRKRQE